MTDKTSSTDDWREVFLFRLEMALSDALIPRIERKIAGTRSTVNGDAQNVQWKEVEQG